jgi:hypothetical protein
MNPNEDRILSFSGTTTSSKTSTVARSGRKLESPELYLLCQFVVPSMSIPSPSGSQSLHGRIAYEPNQDR